MSSWVNWAIGRIESDYMRSADTHLLKVSLPAVRNIDLYLKDETTHPTGSLKHRLARSLFLYALCNGSIRAGTTIVEASSGSTAISEAYFADMLNLPFIAVVPKSTSQEKIEQIAFYNGKCHFVDSGSEIYAEASRLAGELNGYYMDQFTFAERATDWRGNNNIAESIFEQMSLEPFPIPDWIVVGAGTGGTSATIGRYIRYKSHQTKLCVADPQNSVFFNYFHTGDRSLTSKKGSRIEGIGRPRVEPSFMPNVIDRMIRVPDVATCATLRFLEKLLGRRCGGSTGTNLYATFQLITELNQLGKAGSVVSMICDSGTRYSNSYFNDAWLEQHDFNLAPILLELEKFYATGLLDIKS